MILFKAHALCRVTKTWTLDWTRNPEAVAILWWLQLLNLICSLREIFMIMVFSGKGHPKHPRLLEGKATDTPT